MDKRRILIISRGFHPDIAPRAFRATELAKEFGRKGHDVTVLIPNKDFNYSDFEKEYSVKVKFIGKFKCHEINSHAEKKLYLMQRALRRLLLMLFEYPSIELMPLIKKALKTENNYDLLLSIAVPFPIHWGVAWARTKYNMIARIWVADCGDPYMGDSTDSFRKLFYFKYVEKWFCRKCDYISVPFDALKDKFYPEFSEKIITIPQGFRTEDITLAGPVNNRVPTFAYAGSIIPGIRDLSLFFKILNKTKIEFKFYIYTQQPDHYKKYKEQFNENLQINSYLPRLQLLYELSKCDFLVNVDTIYDGQSLNTAFPSKLIDYSFTGRPILNICSDDINEDMVHEFLTGNYFHKREINVNKYKIETVAETFLGLLN
jgi:hypothetical protein